MQNDDTMGDAVTRAGSADYAHEPAPQIPEIPQLALHQQKTLALRVYEVLQDSLPARVARGALEEEEKNALIAGMLCIAKTLDDADHFVDVREPLDPRAHLKLLKQLETDLAAIKGRPRRSTVKEASKSAVAAAPFIPTPFDADE